jgi:hypothetical protein
VNDEYVSDLQNMVAGAGFATTVVPEPGTLGLMSISTLGLLYRRRRMRCTLTGAVSRDRFEFDAPVVKVKSDEYVSPIKPVISRKERARAQWLNY